MSIILNHQSIRLLPAWNGLLAEARRLGPVRTVVRNESAWLAQCLDLGALRLEAGTADLESGSAHLRADVADWHSAYHIDERPLGRPIRSLRWYDRDGHPAIELFVPEAGWPVLDMLVAGFEDPAQTGPPQVLAAERRPEPPNDELDVQRFRAEWDRLGTRRSFDALLQRFGIRRPQAYRLAGPARAARIDPAAIPGLIRRAQADGTMVLTRVFAGTGSAARVGPITRCIVINGELQVAGPCFALAVQLGNVATVWQVTRPGAAADPAVALECFDAHDDRVAGIAFPRGRFVDYV